MLPLIASVLHDKAEVQLKSAVVFSDFLMLTVWLS